MFSSICLFLIIFGIEGMIVEKGVYEGYGVNGVTCGHKEEAHYKMIYYDGQCFANEDKYKPKPVVAIQRPRRGRMRTSGDSVTNRQAVQSRIVKGKDAAIGEAPWVVRITFVHVKEICTGTLISYKLVLTSADCVHRRHNNTTPVRVWIGSPYKDKQEMFNSTHVEEHYNYVKSDGKTYNISYNIAIIKLREDLTPKVDENGKYLINPICLPKPKDAPDSTALSQEKGLWVAGWGLFTKDWTSYPGVLQLGEREVTNECHGHGTICAKYEDAHNAVDITLACAGDSGGPLFQFPPRQLGEGAVLIGVDTGHKEMCTIEDVEPYVFIPPHMSWIMEKVRALGDI